MSIDSCDLIFRNWEVKIIIYIYIYIFSDKTTSYII